MGTLTFLIVAIPGGNTVHKNINLLFFLHILGHSKRTGVAEYKVYFVFQYGTYTRAGKLT